MAQEINANQEKMNDQSSRKNNVFKKIIKGILVVSLLIAGYVYQEEVKEFLDEVVVITVINKGFKAVELGVIPEGIREINGVEYDLAQLKEEYGVYYPLVVPMTKKEISRQHWKLIIFMNHNHDSTKFFQDFGYTLKTEDMPEGTNIEFSHFKSEMVRRLNNGEIMPTHPFMDIVRKNSSCWTGEFAGCQMYSNIESRIIYDFSEEVIREYRDEYVLRFWLFEFEIWDSFLGSKGYNLDDYVSSSRTRISLTLR